VSASEIISAASAPDAPQELLKARENLKLSEQTRDRIAEEVSTLKASGKASPEIVAAYEVYLSRVQEIVIEHQKLAAQMEDVYRAHQNRAQTETAASAAGPAPTPDSAGESADRLQELDRRFNQSLAAFDEMLLKELKLIQAASAGRMQGLTESAAAAGRQAGGKSRQAPSAETEGSATGESGSENGSAGTEQAGTSEGRGKPGEEAGAGQGGGGWGSGGSGAPPGSSRPSPDDDIVARQLREAAEKETNPELKAKLWKEYEAYKKSRAKP
jgi:hypothetical protein